MHYTQKACCHRIKEYIFPTNGDTGANLVQKHMILNHTSASDHSNLYKSKLPQNLKLSALSKKPDLSSRTSPALYANQFTNQFGSRGEPVYEPVRFQRQTSSALETNQSGSNGNPVWELVKEWAKKPVILLYIIIIFNNRQVYWYRLDWYRLNWYIIAHTT